MIGNHKKLIKVLNILRGFEEFRHQCGYGAVLKMIEYNNWMTDFSYNSSGLKIVSVKTRESIKTTLHPRSYPHPSDISKNRVYFREDGEHMLGIRYSDNVLKMHTKTLSSENLDINTLLEEENHFQYSLIDTAIPEIEVIKETQEIFNLYSEEDIGFVGKLTIPNIDYDGFLAHFVDKTAFVKEYWDSLGYKNV